MFSNNQHSNNDNHEKQLKTKGMGSDFKINIHTISEMVYFYPQVLTLTSQKKTFNSLKYKSNKTIP